MARPKVLYILGPGRSGSTLLDRLLAVDDTLALGEFCHYPFGRMPRDARCGCGRMLPDCSTWQCLPPYWADDNKAIPHTLTRSVGIMLHLALGTPSAMDHLQELTDRFVDCYQRLWRAHGPQLIVDSSKSPGVALLLGRRHDLDLRLVWLRRDPRAVAYSLQRNRGKPELSTVERLDTHGPVMASAMWDWGQVGGMFAARTRVPTLVLEYDRLTSAPGATWIQIRQFADMPNRKPPLDEAGWFRPASRCSMSGNPMRMAESYRVRADDEWRMAMPAWQRRVITTLTWPFRGIR